MQVSLSYPDLTSSVSVRLLDSSLPRPSRLFNSQVLPYCFPELLYYLYFRKQCAEVPFSPPGQQPWLSFLCHGHSCIILLWFWLVFLGWLLAIPFHVLLGHLPVFLQKCLFRSADNVLLEVYYHWIAWARCQRNRLQISLLSSRLFTLLFHSLGPHFASVSAPTPFSSSSPLPLFFLFFSSLLPLLSSPLFLFLSSPFSSPLLFLFFSSPLFFLYSSTEGRVQSLTCARQALLSVKYIWKLLRQDPAKFPRLDPCP